MGSRFRGCGFGGLTLIEGFRIQGLEGWRFSAQGSVGFGFLGERSIQVWRSLRLEAVWN